MSDDEMMAQLKVIDTYLKEQHRVAMAIVRNFLELATAVGPVMEACQDTEVLLKFRSDLERLNANVSVLIEQAETVH